MFILTYDIYKYILLLVFIPPVTAQTLSDMKSDIKLIICQMSKCQTPGL